MQLRGSSHQKIVNAAAFSLLAMLALIGLTHDANAQEVKKKTEVNKKTVASLEGSWSGSGSVSFASGSREQARCRAHYRRAGNNSTRSMPPAPQPRAELRKRPRCARSVRTDIQAVFTTVSIRFRA